MIKVKRLDQGSPQVGDGKTPAKAEEAPPAPYKVYSSPMIADDPPINITIGGGETPSIPISETATPSEALSSWQRETQE
ncbi:MAG TPA: hypothetical protein DCY07_03530, partial [Rhodospirillaceae bacterium]|nr:hypothetical protein [Rhodospirillaceae bacterium]